MSESVSEGDPRREWRWVWPLMAAVALMFAWRALRHFDNWGIQDWDSSVFYVECARKVLVDHHQFPLWNPWFCGGTPLLARPEATSCGPAFLLPLVFGGFKGIRFLILVYLTVGLAGTYRLGRHHGLGPPAAALAALVYMCGGVFTSHLTCGNTWILPMALIPWAFLFFLRGLVRTDAIGNSGRQAGRRGTHAPPERPEADGPPRGAMAFLDPVACAVCLALIWLGGAPYLLVMTVFCFGLYAVFAVMSREALLRDAVRVLGVAGGVTFGLCAIQLIPCMEFTLQYPRVQDAYRGFSVQSLGFGLLHRDQSLHAVDLLEKIEGFWRGVSHGMNETGTYVGLMPLVLCLVGVVTHGRRRLALLLCACVCVWLSFGPRAAPLSLWNLLHDLPVFSIMRVPERFRIMFLLSLAIFAGLGLEVVGKTFAEAQRARRVPRGQVRGRGRAGADLMAREGRPSVQQVRASAAPTGTRPGDGRVGNWGLAAVVGVTIFVFVDLMLVVAPLLNQTFTIRPITIPPAPGGAFVQTAMYYPLASGRWAREGDDTLRCAWSSHYPALMANQGIVEGNDEIPTPRMAVPVEDRRGYQGEVFLYQTGGTVRYTRWSPNVLRVAVQASGAGYVVFNQNYFTGWHARERDKRVERVGGLLAVKVGPADREVEIYYRPWSVVLGAWVSALSWLGVGAWGWRNRRGLGVGAALGRP